MDFSKFITVAMLVLIQFLMLAANPIEEPTEVEEDAHFDEAYYDLLDRALECHA